MELKFSKLPLEILEKVLIHVSHPDRLVMRLVCKLWAQVFEESPRCWSGVTMYVTDENMAKVPEKMKSKKMKLLRQLKVYAYMTHDIGVRDVEEQLIEAVVDHPVLKVVDLSRIDLSKLDPDLLAKAVCRMESVNLYGTNLSKPQMDTLFSSIAQESKLKKLLIGDLVLRPVAPELLAKAVNKLEYVNLYYSVLTQEQKKAIFTAITVETKLKSLKMQSWINLDDSHLLARAVNSLEEVDLSHAILNIQQLETVLQESLRPDSRLRRFWLEDVSALSEVDKELISMAASKYELFLSSVSVHHCLLPPT